MRETLRKCRVEVSGKGKVEEKPEKRSKDSKRKDSKKKESSVMKKESIENAMKSLFGEDKSGEYRKFISKNWELNEEETIAKWIEEVTK